MNPESSTSWRLDMNVNPKVVAAVTAAVDMYLQSEGRPAALEVEAKRPEPAAPAVTFSPWAHSGRQSMMELKRLIQLRLVH